MRVKEGFVMREVAGQYVVIAVGEASKTFHGMIKLNRTGKDIWECLQDGLEEEQIVAVLQERYQVAIEEVKQDVQEFIAKMKEMEFLADE